MLDNHKQRTLRGVVWNFSKVFGQTLLGLGVNIVLARNLDPSDFGVLALAMVFISFAELFSSIGLGPSIVQRKVLTGRHLQVATTSSLISGILLVIIFVASADAIAAFFEQPKLATAIHLLAGSLLFTAVAAPSRGVLIRRMDFRSLSAVDVGSYLLGFACVSVALAIQGFGVWSLVIGNVCASVLSSIALLILVPPRLPLLLARQESFDLLGFGSGVSINSAINHLAANVDYIVLGKYLTPDLVGLYTKAYQLVTMPLTKIAGTMSSVLFSSYAEIQEDKDKLGRAYFRAVNATALATFPVLMVCAVASETIVVGMYGSAWRGAVDVFRILCIAGMLKAIFHLAGAVVQATGNVYAEVKCQTMYLIFLTAGCLIAVNNGIAAVGWAVVFGSLWLYLAMAHLALRIIGGKWRTFFAAQMPGFSVGLIVALTQIVVVWGEKNWLSVHPATALVILLVTSAVSLVSVILFFPKAIVGDMPSWIADHYGHRLPNSIQRLLLGSKPKSKEV